ncbi:hypothetical protein BDF19DRAFT_437033 [Syncephalis fuscata]|nr:hypothetical protein BDF19DRAFT_437033 [Syncephalis fuscata]
MGSRAIHEAPPSAVTANALPLSVNSSVDSSDTEATTPDSTVDMPQQTTTHQQHPHLSSNDVDISKEQNNSPVSTHQSQVKFGLHRVGAHPVPFNHPANMTTHMEQPLSSIDTAESLLYDYPKPPAHRHGSLSTLSAESTSRLPIDDPDTYEQTLSALLVLVRTHLLPDHAYKACDSFIRDWITLLSIPQWNDVERRDSLLGLTVRYLSPGELEGGLEAVDQCITSDVFAQMCTLSNRLLQLEQARDNNNNNDTSLLEEGEIPTEPAPIIP